MSRRPSLTNIAPVELVKGSASQTEGSKSRSNSSDAKHNDDNRPKEESQISSERPRATSPAPPIRNNPTANAPLRQPKVVAKSRQSQLFSKSRLQWKSNKSYPQQSEIQIGGSKKNASSVLSRSDLNAVQAAINVSEKRSANRSVPVSDKDIRKLHSTLRDWRKGKTTFEMTFQPRKRCHSFKSQDISKPGETAKSMDSGNFSLTEDYDENLVTEWRPQWQKNKAGSAPGEIKNIKGICFTDDDRVVVTEEKNSRIQIFDKKRGDSYTVLQDTFRVHGMQLAGICQLPYKNFLAATDRQRVLYWEPLADGIHESITFDKQVHMHGIAVSPREHLFLTDLEKKKVYSYALSGRRILTFKPEDFLRPDYVAISEEYSIVFVSDSEQGCVYMLNMDGELLNKIGRQGTDQEKLIYPLGVCCLPNGKLIVADRAQHRLSTYDFRARCYEHVLTRDDLLYSPTCIATDGNKYLAVAEENYDYKVDEYKLKMFYRCRK